jgi:hypothetical protein
MPDRELMERTGRLRSRGSPTTPSIEVRWGGARAAWVRRAAVALTAAALLAGAYGLGRLHPDRARVAVPLEPAAVPLPATAPAPFQIEEDGAALHARLASAQRDAQVDREASRLLQARLVALQQEVAELHDEVAFYRGILDRDHDTPGLVIGTLLLAPAADPGAVRYTLLLTRGRIDREPVSGRVELRLRYPGVADDADRPPPLVRPFEFRYYTRLEGLLELPGDAVPEALEVRASATAEGIAGAERSFPWTLPQAAGRGG